MTRVIYVVYNHSRLIKLNCLSFGRGNVQKYRGRGGWVLSVWRPQMYLATRDQANCAVDWCFRQGGGHKLHNNFLKVWVSSLPDLCRELMVESPQSWPISLSLYWAVGHCCHCHPRYGLNIESDESWRLLVCPSFKKTFLLMINSALATASVMMLEFVIQLSLTRSIELLPAVVVLDYGTML